MSLIRNERIKFLATAPIGVAVGCITAGVVAPLTPLVMMGSGQAR